MPLSLYCFRNSGMLWNFNFKFHIHVGCGYGLTLIDFERCHFQNGSQIGIFVIRALNLVWLWISSPSFTRTSPVCMGKAYWFSTMPLSKWPSGGLIGFFGIWTVQVACFPERYSSLLWNFNFKFHMHIVIGNGPKYIDFQRCHFQNGRLMAILDFSVSGL